MLKKKVLIFGITGQDGSLLAQLLLKKKYNVFGYSRNIKKNKNLKKLKIEKKVKLIQGNYYNYKLFEQLIKKNKFHEIYFFAGQTLPKISNQIRIATLLSNIVPVFNILDILQKNRIKSRFFNASSCEIFGSSNKSFRENSSKNPNTVYGLSKLISLELVRFYRIKFGIQCFSGILFHHESTLRNDKFVIKKIVSSLIKFKKKNKPYKIKFGNINANKDWGWAPEYIKIIHKIINSKNLDDYIIATGKSNSVKSVIEYAFKKMGYDWKKYITIADNLKRDKTEIYNSKANNNKLFKSLKFKPKKNVFDVVDKLLNGHK